ncbi:hypothetical protein E4U55_000791 [Claviceps digitariae]|nr:hypothetical protein E4U55_000791 [Claviceps digitariae]
MIHSVFHPWKTFFQSLCRSLKLRWTTLRQFLSLTRVRIFPFWRPKVTPRWPPTGRQREEQREAFIQSISKSAVAALASRHNDNKECVVSDHVRSGSYNVCLFVTFPTDKTEWVVRIPITPMLVDEWTKLESEVATMRYVKRNTTIPIPNIHAYGKGEHLTEDKHTTQSFLIMDKLPGNRLDVFKLCSSPQDIQDRFYDEFVGILTQLLELEFPRTGSLYPDSTDKEREIIGPSLYLIENDMEVDTGIHRDATSGLKTTSEVLEQLHDILEYFQDIPTYDLVTSSSRRDVFAQHSFADLLVDYHNSSPKVQPLALHHGDLRCGNILVDDDFRIKGIIDWEWVTILPRQFCTPPLWICGLDNDLKDNAKKYWQRYASRTKIFEAFQRATAANEKYKEYNKCLKFWTEERLRMPISFILRCPHYLDMIYYWHIYPAIYDLPFEKMQDAFFALEHMQRKLEHRRETSKRYEDYLKQEGLYIVEEKHLRMREWLEKTDKLMKEVHARLGTDIQIRVAP